jgi:hypothetical protein
MPTDLRPNLFIVGAQKSGTSALAGWLGEHPEVLMAFPKEPGYLAFGEAGYTCRDGYGRPGRASHYVVTSEADYLELFAGGTAQQHVRGEASTWYLVQPDMPATLEQFSPGARVIIVLRNPVQRAYSAWCHARGDDTEPCERFAEALAMESRREEPEHLLRYHRMGLYADDLKAFLSVFAPDRLLVLFYDDMKADPAAFWQQVCAFLDIDAGREPPYRRQYNRSGNPRSRLLQNALRSHRLKRALRAVIPHQLAVRVKNRLDDINLRSFPPMDDATRDALRDYYRDDIREVARLTGRNLDAWLS